MSTMDKKNENTDTKQGSSNLKNDTFAFDDTTSCLVLTETIHNPLKEVSNRSSGLSSAPKNLDFFSQQGSKSYNLTTWNTISRCYYAGHTVRKAGVSFSDEKDEFVKLNVSGLRTGTEVDDSELDHLSEFYAKAVKDGRYSIDKNGKVIKNSCIIDTYMDDRYFDLSEDADDCSYLYSDMIPVKSVAVTRWPTFMNTNDVPEYSPMYVSFLDRLSDPQSTGALGSLVRSSVVRDASSVMSLVKTMKNHPSSTFEHAALLRSICMCVSMDKQTYDMDSLPMQMIRRFKPDRKQTTTYSIGGSTSTQKFSMLAISLDNYCALMNNKLNDEMPAGWKYPNMDDSVAVVPISSTALSSRWALAYIASFLDSSLWSGRVNVHVPGSWMLYDWKQSTAHRGTVTLMPSINSVVIPGPTKALLVLVDHSTRDISNNIRIGGTTLKIPVVTDDKINNAIDFQDYWNTKYFYSGNHDQVATDACSAYNEIVSKLCVGNASGLALSAAAELYGCMPLGLMAKTTTYGRDGSELLSGAWGYGESSSIDNKNGVLNCRSWAENFDHKDNSTWRMNIVGFNFSMVSPLHFAACGMISTQHVVSHKKSKNGKDIPETIFVNWSGQETNTVDRYRINTCNGPTRIGIYVGLVNTSSNSPLMQSSAALTAYIHMQSCALAFSTVSMLCANNIPFKQWCGFNTNNSNVAMLNNLNYAIEHVTQNFCSYVDVMNLASASSDWDWDCILSYYSFTSMKDDNLYSYSPVPYQCVKQWLDKIGNLVGEVVRKTSCGELNDNYYEGLSITNSSKHYKFLVPGALDIKRHCPNVIYGPAVGSDKNMGIWVNNWCTLSANCHTGREYYKYDSDFYSSGCLALSTIDWVHNTDFNNKIVVINSKYMYDTGSKELLHASPLTYPDPPNSFLANLRDYIAVPALNALGGYVTGGPVGSLVAGGASVAKQILKDNIGQKATSTPSITQPVHVNDVGESDKTIDSPELEEGNE